MTRPVLYTFRRCPYAIRARLGIAVSGVEVEIREVVLRDKPESMLHYSPKATVPVLVLAEGTPEQAVVDESRDVLSWSLEQHDPRGWLESRTPESRTLVDRNDGEFKGWLDRYKYSVRYPEDTRESYREKAMAFIHTLDDMLERAPFLAGEQRGWVDAAIFPFVRQFAFADKRWFDAEPIPNVHRWLTAWLDSSLFKSVMIKYPQWQPGHDITLFRGEVGEK